MTKEEELNNQENSSEETAEQLEISRKLQEMGKSADSEKKHEEAQENSEEELKELPGIIEKRLENV